MNTSRFPQPIGDSIARPRGWRLMEGRGCYTDDMVLPRMVHVAFLRSPHPHARLVSIDTSEASAALGVLRNRHR